MISEPQPLITTLARARYIGSISSPYSVISNLLDLNNKSPKQVEGFVALLLDSYDMLLDMRLVAIGDTNNVEVSVPEVLKFAMAPPFKVKLILAHNHPSGDVTPSSDDINLTETFKTAAKLLNVTIADHIIVGDTQFYSFAENKIRSFATGHEEVEVVSNVQEFDRRPKIIKNSQVIINGPLNVSPPTPVQKEDPAEKAKRFLYKTDENGNQRKLTRKEKLDYIIALGPDWMKFIRVIETPPFTLETLLASDESQPKFKTKYLFPLEEPELMYPKPGYIIRQNKDGENEYVPDNPTLKQKVKSFFGGSYDQPH